MCSLLRKAPEATHTADLSSLWSLFHATSASSVRLPTSNNMVRVGDVYCSASLRVAWYRATTKGFMLETR